MLPSDHIQLEPDNSSSLLSDYHEQSQAAKLLKGPREPTPSPSQLTSNGHISPSSSPLHVTIRYKKAFPLF